MAFGTEPTGYHKTALSDLQGAWTNLRNEVADNFGFPNSDRLLLHIDEAMSWESVRDLGKMKSTLLVIQNITAQTEVPIEVAEWVHSVRENLDETLLAIREGDVL
ncbi:MAG: hypothetical protein U9R74_01625 [Pseudomonadota bacterium]|nr:hypothetical protein [Pseudomonadota bacterium]